MNNNDVLTIMVYSSAVGKTQFSRVCLKGFWQQTDVLERQ